jgi:hypothetical protein
VPAAPHFPYWLVCGVLPAALLTAAGIAPLWCGLVLLGQVGCAGEGAGAAVGLAWTAACMQQRRSLHHHAHDMHIQTHAGPCLQQHTASTARQYPRTLGGATYPRACLDPTRPLHTRQPHADMQELSNDAHMTLVQMRSWVLHGNWPNELVVGR